MSIDGEPRILGREEELLQLRSLVYGARNAVGGALLVRGEPGIGKTTLVESALAEHDTFRIVRLQGVEVEASFPYAALQRLAGPLADHTDAIPDAPRTALRVAIGAEAGDPPQPALVGLGALSMLAASADDRPTVWFVDDAHHIDEESLVVLGFVARRVSAERVAVILASRPSDGVETALAGVPRVELGGLDAASASWMLRQSVRGDLDGTTAAAFVMYTGGNPLALRELATEWTAEQLTASALSHAPVPIGRRLEQLYSQQLAELPPATRTWLVVAAAESTGDLATVTAAAAALGVTEDASAAAEQIEFVTVRDAVRFRHPLIRSAVYAHATEVERRAAHRALRVEARARDRLDLAACHAAAASAGPDAAVADEIAAAADVAGTRGGTISRAHLLARAADLSPAPAVRSERYLAAAEAGIAAGAARLAWQMLAKVDVASLGAVGRGRALMVEAMCGIYLSDPAMLRRGATLLLESADALADNAPDAAQQALLLALNSFGVTEDRATDATLDQLGTRMRALSSGTGVRDAVLRGVGALILDPYEQAVPLLREAVSALEAQDDRQVPQSAFYAVVPCVSLWDWEAGSSLLRRAVRVAREKGALPEAETALWTLSALELSRTEPGRAREYLAQAAELRTALGSSDEQAVNAAQLAWDGASSAVVEQIARATGEAGWGGIERMAVGAIAITEIARNAYDIAYPRLTELVGRPYLQASSLHLPDYIEAAVRSGDLPAAEAALATLERFATANESVAARGLLRRAQALLADDDRAEALYVASVDALDAAGHRGDSARSRLLYGDWLRRVRRRGDARAAWQAAREIFVDVGATAFAERAARELLASGASIDSPVGRQDLLTPQEHEIARLASGGATNAEIGARMFISTNTVDYHLRKVFRKLDITSRRQLRDHPVF